MDALELPLPLDLAPTPKLMGSEGFSLIQNAEFSSCNKFAETQLSKNSSQLPHLKGEEASKNSPSGNGKSSPVINSRLEGVSLQRKAAKSSRSNSSCSKRPRISQPEDSLCPIGIEESKDISDKLGSNNLSCTSPEKSQLPKQRSNASKRGDKRNFKVPSAKTKFESSSMKMCASIFSSTSAGNNFFGLYGLKHDFHDVTKLMDEPPLDDLLRGTFDCPVLSKDKGKKTSNMSVSFLNSVRKACSILQLPKSIQSQNISEVDYSSNMKMSTCQLSSVCAAEIVGNGDKEQSLDMSSCQKDHCSETESSTSPLDFPLHQPKDVLERLAVHPLQELESLLLDVSKPAATTKNSNNDQRSGKQLSRRPSLPAFTWSHAFGGHSRTNSDAVKSSASRSTCQGKWSRIGVITGSTNTDRSSFTNLDTFSYDQSLVPSSGSSEKKNFSSLFANLPFHHLDSSSSVSCSEDSQAKAERGGQVDTKENDERCPRILTAAQTLCEIATRSPRQSSDGILRWQRKTSQKAMKACRYKSNEKLEEMTSRSISTIGSDMVGRSVEQIIPSKKPRFSIVENKNSSHYNNDAKKGHFVWPISKSSRSLPSKQVRDSFVENKRTNASILKQHCMMPPPARDLSKVHDGQQQVGKLVVMDWKRGRDNTD
ncbi:uncharacterized protein LOC106769326 isoform X2 [Vigna radiata var. radiata]|uniref:Uncharacterized protein LOC106769326 isoform X2 n=1 Tax=Vigna radiata var. radiata TaxID=3916 RepID=A0A1S3UWX6_VIGRR|nr:uncharacterized protein LOC106769326 isoform X2 [Vigna radiata var. radiata]